MTTTNEPRALTTALQSPAFVTRGGGAALHAANRHVERWAPETEAHRSRPLRNLGFVDRLVSPWIESAQRSASIRMFSQYMTSPVGERPASNVSWVFPRPWYQDELDWMTAAREVRTHTALDATSAPSMFTTRGTYVAPSQPRTIALPSTLHEYVAPSLSMARPDAPVASVDAYSPLVSFAAAQAAHVMASAAAPIVSTPAARMSVGLRSVLTTLLARSANAAPYGELSTRSSERAPELVTPPAPRPDMTPAGDASVASATSIAEQYAEQRARIVDLQRVARIAAEREAARTQAQPARQVEIQQRIAETERARADERTAQVAQLQQRARQQQEAARLHEASRDAAARDARTLPTPAVEMRAPQASAAAAEQRPFAAEIAAAVAALPPELATLVASGIGRQPERAAQAIGELGEALRAIELMARTTAAGGTFESARGPRVVMPAGLGGLVSTVERTTAPQGPAMPRTPMLAAQRTASVSRASREMRMPALAFLAAPTAANVPAPTSAIGAAAANPPAALGHVAWSDRWLARFAGAGPQSLDALAAASGSSESRFQMLAESAPSVFVAPEMPAARPAAPVRSDDVVRYDDNAETPDDVLFAISAAASRSRRAAAQPAAPKVETAATPSRPEASRETLADLVAHSAPSAPGAGLSAQLASSPFAVALRHVLPLGVAPTFDVRALFGSDLGASYLEGLISTTPDAITLSAPTMPIWASWGDPSTGATETTAREVADFLPTYVAPDAGVASDEAGQTITTLRSSLLSFDVESAQASASRALETRTTSTSPSDTGSAPLARSLVEHLAMPMLGDAAALEQPGTIALDRDHLAQAAYTAPGMVADRAQSWSVAQERSTSDLAFDFVSPELVLAARVYGLGPIEAAQAARLAIAGPGPLSAMASAVDRTFVQAMAIEAQRRGERGAITTAYPVAVNEAGAPAATSATSDASSVSAEPATAYVPSASTFGVERRAPRGAFLWPAAASAALGMTAASPDGEQSMSVAALELLAAQAVAELGTFAALGALGEADRSALASVASRGDGTAMAPVSAAGESGPRDEDVLASAMSFVPASRRDKFQALYLALSSSSAGRTASPAARAARALALAGTGDEAVSARERASIAWDVLPVVYGVDANGESPAQRALSTGEAAVELTRRREALRAIDPTYVEERGHGLAARAGEALGSYVAPSAASPAPSVSARDREVGAVLRAPTAAPELVQTGRPAGQFGGGEVELPAWFEKAARKMLEERGGISENVSLAELTLVTSAPSSAIAASDRVSQGAATAQVAPAAAAAGGEKQQVDIEKIANEVYREILMLMDTARVRNGEPYL